MDWRYPLVLLLASTSWLLGDAITPSCEHNSSWEEQTFSTLRLTKRYFTMNGNKVDSLVIRFIMNEDSMAPYDRTIKMSGVSVQRERVSGEEIRSLDLKFDYISGGNDFHKE